MEFKKYWLSLSVEERESFALSLEVTSGHLRNIAYESRDCGEKLAIEIEKKTAGKVRCEDLCPEVDWKYLRNSA